MIKKLIFHPQIQSNSFPLFQQYLTFLIYPLNKKDGEENTPLHLAVKFQNVKAVGILLTHGAKPLALNNEGQMPENLLHCEYLSEKCGACEKISKLLLDCLCEEFKNIVLDGPNSRTYVPTRKIRKDDYIRLE